jgi:hypothetical protein
VKGVKLQRTKPHRERKTVKLHRRAVKQGYLFPILRGLVHSLFPILGMQKRKLTILEK